MEAVSSTPPHLHTFTLMKTLYLIRHGTVLNPNKVMYRRLPGFLLSEQGHTEAGETRDFLADVRMETIWHSPLERAVQTARIVNEKHNAPMTEELRIHEWDEGEDSDEVLERMRSFLESWRETDYQISAAVSHRDPIRRLLFALENRDAPPLMDDLAHFPLPQGGIYRITEEQGVLRSQLAFVPTIHLEHPPIEVDKVTGR